LADHSKDGSELKKARPSSAECRGSEIITAVNVNITMDIKIYGV
jgi:hypothetical protein